MAKDEEEWFSLVVEPGVDQKKPGIYEWNIQGVGSYIGKYTHISRPLKEYSRNVNRLLYKLHYRPKNPEGFRHIHRMLAEARVARTPITLILVENVEPARLNDREQKLIRTRGNLNRTPGRLNDAPRA